MHLMADAEHPNTNCKYSLRTTKSRVSENVCSILYGWDDVLASQVIEPIPLALYFSLAHYFSHLFTLSLISPP